MHKSIFPLIPVQKGETFLSIPTDEEMIAMWIQLEKFIKESIFRILLRIIIIKTFNDYPARE